MMLRIVTVLLCLFALPVRAADTVPDTSTALDAWVNAVESGNARNVVKLYDDKSIMISSFAQEPITTRADLLNYYQKVVVNPDVKVDVVELHSRRYGNTAINSGEYMLSYTQEGETISIPARFSFTYVLHNNQWVIVDHHSSRVPLPDEIAQ